jgi:hypothetical protein
VEPALKIGTVLETLSLEGTLPVSNDKLNILDKGKEMLKL